MLTKAALTHPHPAGSQIPRVVYSAREVETWGAVYAKLRTYTRAYAVEQYNAILPLLERVRACCSWC